MCGFIFNSVNCAPWAQLVNSPSCLDDSLLVNRWASQEALTDMTEADKRCLLYLHLITWSIFNLSFTWSTSGFNWLRDSLELWIKKSMTEWTWTQGIYHLYYFIIRYMFYSKEGVSGGIRKWFGMSQISFPCPGVPSSSKADSVGLLLYIGRSLTPFTLKVSWRGAFLFL